MAKPKWTFAQFPDLTFSEKVIRQRIQFAGRLYHNHQGRMKAIHSKQIEKALGLTGPAVRDLRSICQRMRLPICSNTKDGYWWGNIREVQTTKRQYLSRVKQIMLCVDGLEQFEKGFGVIEITDGQGNRL